MTEKEVQCISGEQDIVEDGQGTDNGIEESINHWVSSITDSGVVKKKKKRDKHKHYDITATELDVCSDNDSATIDPPLQDSKKKSKPKKRDIDVDRMIKEDNEETVVEQKKKRKHKASAEDVPVEKKTKLEQIADDETELPPVKKHKKKKIIE